MKKVGRRRIEGDPWMDQGRLASAAAFLRGTPALVPRGVYRFRTFDEAEAWMTRTMIETLARRRQQTSSASAVP